MLQTGAPVPDVVAEDDAGSPVRLRDLGKKALVVYFYPRADTPGCTSETIQFRDLNAAFKKKGVTVVGVSRDTVAAQAKFKAKYEVPFRLLADVAIGAMRRVRGDRRKEHLRQEVAWNPTLDVPNPGRRRDEGMAEG